MTDRTPPDGNPFRIKPIIRVENALVEEVVFENIGTGYILISYRRPEKSNIANVELLRLNISPFTRIENQFSERIRLMEIRKGMRVNAAFSSAITRSIPPQSSAFEIVVLTNPHSTKTTISRVIRIDVPGGFLYTGNPFDPLHQMKFVVNNATVITDENGNRIRLRNLHIGQMVRVEHANFQTMSIPPQTTAFRIHVLRRK